jgi:hypothetical protein
MSFKARFKVGGKDLPILNAEYKFFQEVDATGRPSSIGRGGLIEISLESTGDSFFYEWMTDNFDRKDGTIEYSKRDTDAKLKEIKFSEAYMVKYEEIFDSTGINPLVEKFTISAKEVTIGNGTQRNEWTV